MSDNENASGKKIVGWTEREKLTYLVMCLERAGGIKWNEVPLPVGRSQIACQRMVERLKSQLRDDIDAFKAGKPLPGSNMNGATKAKASTPRKKKTAEDESPKPKTPRKRKVADGEQDEGNLKKKKGVKKEENEEEMNVKMEDGEEGIEDEI